MNVPPRPLVEADLHAFVDGQMDVERRSAVVHAMACDPEVRAKVDQWRRQNEALAATFGGVLREPLPLRLMPMNLARATPNGAKTGASRQCPAPEAGSARGPSARVAAIAVAAFLAGGALVFAVDALSVNSEPLGASQATDNLFPYGARALALRAYEAHRTFATDLNHPVEVAASDEDHLLKWIQHRLSMPIRIPDLRPQGWTLIGGRILPGEFGPAAFLMYGNGVERLGLYIARTNIRQGNAFSVYDNGAGLGSVGSWGDGPVGYAVTTDRDGAWLDRNGAELQQTILVQAQDNALAE